MANIEIIENNTDKILAELSDAVEMGLETVGMVAESHAKAYETAVDTGLLRNSITHQVNKGKKEVYIGTNVEYAPYVELGHRLPNGGHVAGIHYLEKAVTNHMGQYELIMTMALEGK